MEEIIKQIAQIDSVAVSNRANSDRALKEKRQKYENEILAYREDKIRSANKQAEEIYNQIIITGETGSHLETEKCRKSALETQNRYLEIEETLLNEVFNELFRVEG